MRVSAVWLVVGLVVLLAASGAGAVPAAGVLRAPEKILGRPSILPKWQRVVAALAAEEDILRNCLNDANACRDNRLRAWRDSVRAAAGRPLREQLERINRFFNGFVYRPDSAVWGQSDFWATPLEFLARSGDCEDYAIAKYATLRILGVPDHHMRLVVLRDTRRNLVHAVLAVSDGKRRFILDNLYSDVLLASQLPHYRPYYSVNAEAVWRPQSANLIAELHTGSLRPARR